MCDHDALTLMENMNTIMCTYGHLYNYKTRIFFWNESSYASIQLNDNITLSYFTSNRFLFSEHKGNTKTKIEQAE